MKYLLVFYFAGFFLADAAQIKKYKLGLKLDENEFQGTVTLTLSDSNNNDDVELDPYHYDWVNCTYYGTDDLTTEPTTVKTTEPTTVRTTEPTTEKTIEPITVNTTEPTTVRTTEPTTEKTTEPTTVKTTEPTTVKTTEPTTEPTTVKTTEPTTVKTTEPTTEPTTEKTTEPTTVKTTEPTTEPQSKKQKCTIEGNKIKFDRKRTSEDVILTFKGKYGMDGLSEHKITESNDRFYVANMTAKNHKIIFPCYTKGRAQFEFEGDGAVMSNLEHLRNKDEKHEVSLRDLVFVQGDIVKDDTSIPNFPYYHMKSSGKMGQKLKKVMEKVAELDPSLQILFTPIKEEIPIISRDVIILSDVVLSNDSESDLLHISRKLAAKWFQRSKGEAVTFFDIVGPQFVTMKISGVSGFPFEGYLKLAQIQAFRKDGFNNSKSLNDLASGNGHQEDYLILYVKGTSVLYSLESICGNGNFKEGLKKYIGNGSCKVNEAFVGCFENKDKADEFFKVWTDDPGYPVVHVILNKDAKYDMNHERFLWFGSEQKDQRWIIQTDYKTKEHSEGTITLPATKNNVTVNINSTYFILDHSNKGFYRVNYDAKLWTALISQLKSNHTEIDPVNRMKLIDDVFSFPKSIYNFTHRIPDYVTALKLSEYLKKETDFRALIVAFDALDFLDSALSSSYHGKFRDHMKGILNEVYKNTTLERPELRNKLTELACKFGVEECIKNANESFKKIGLNTTTLSDQEKLAICSVVRNDSTKWMDSLVLLNAIGIGTTEKNSLLGCSRDEKMLTLFLTQFITPKDQGRFIEAVTFAVERNPDNTKVVLDIIKRFEDAITKVFGKQCLQEIVRLTLPKLNSESAVTIQEIAKKLDNPLKEEVDRACKRIKLWTDTKAKSVGEYFKRGGSGSGSQARPIALVLLATTLLPLANHIFHS